MATAAIVTGHFTSIQSPVQNSVCPINLLYAFILYTLLLPFSLCAELNYTNCKNNKKCGAAIIPYPFGLNESGCGLPNFQIVCEDKVRPVIQSGTQKFTVLEFSPDNQTSIIIEDMASQKCSFSDNLNEDAILALGLFDRVLQLQNISIQVFECDWGCGVVLPGFQIPNCGLKWVTVEEVTAHWNIEKDQQQKCTSCLSSGGLCGFNISESNQFLCFCEDAPHQTTCSSGTVVEKNRSNSSKADPKMLGIATGASALIVIMALLLMTSCRKWAFFSCKETQPSVTTELINVKVENFLQTYIHQMSTRYSFSQLKKMTNNFADKLGEGGFGVVYKGKLHTGVLVAVKLLDQSRQSESQFMNEVATLGTIHHVHLVRLMGYCFEAFRSALVYEYMANGSLEKFIFQGKGDQMLCWDQLYSIALGAAREIAYLHEDCSRRIIHFDIKPHNILLDADFTPKVADFGLAKLYGKADDHVSITATRGTPGYVAPQLWSREMGPVTDKSDVYSFGRLLLEIVGKRKNIDVQAGHSSQLYFPEWAFKLMENGQLERALRGIESEDEEKARRVAKVGMWCIQYNSRDRPRMSRVVQMLEGNGDDVSNPPVPFNSSSASQTVLPFHSEEFSSTL